MDNVLLDAYDTVNKIHANKIGGDNRLEWYGTTGKNVKCQKRKRDIFKGSVCISIHYTTVKCVFRYNTSENA